MRNRIAVESYSGKTLVGDLKGDYSARLPLKYRIVYSIHDGELLMLVIRARTHHEIDPLPSHEKSKRKT